MIAVQGVPRIIAKCFAVAVLGQLASVASAATWATTNCGTSGNHSVTCGSAPFVVTGWSTEGASVSGRYEDASVYAWSTGLGVKANSESNTNGPHSIDNVNGKDGVVISFASNSPANLTGLTIGWNGYDNTTGSYIDSDISVYYWASTGTPVNNNSTAGTTDDSLAALSGWKLVGNYDNVGQASGNSVTFAGNSATINTNYSATTFSSYWFIGAKPGGTNDGFKLASVSGVVPPPSGGNGVPEPGSLALFGAAMVGALVVRRRTPTPA